MDDESNEALIEAIAAHADRTAFVALFERFAGRIKGFMMRGGATPDLAEEIAQDVMVTVWRKSASFDRAKAGAATWIFTIARNRRIDLLRREARPEPDANDPMFQPDAEQTPEQRVQGADRDARVRVALATLSEDQREVVHLAFFSGLSHGEIALKLGAPLGTVKSRMRLAFARLRDDLGPEFAEELSDG